jgi:hypothetical protein
MKILRNNRRERNPILVLWKLAANRAARFDGKPSENRSLQKSNKITLSKPAPSVIVFGGFVVFDKVASHYTARLIVQGSKSTAVTSVRGWVYKGDEVGSENVDFASLICVTISRFSLKVRR